MTGPRSWPPPGPEQAEAEAEAEDVARTEELANLHVEFQAQAALDEPEAGL
jgi:hypothetical protein